MLYFTSTFHLSYLDIEIPSDLFPGSSRTFYEMAVNDTDDRIGRDGREGKYLTVLTGPEVTQMDRTVPL